MNLNKKHLISLLSYLGIGFISGSVSHGFFTGTRSIIMASIGFGLFIIGELLHKEEDRTWLQTVIFGLLYSLSIGMISGGLQHFLDSPRRSLRIVPSGFFVSWLVYASKHKWENFNRISVVLGILTTAILGGGLYAAILYIPQTWYSSVARLDDHHDAENQSGVNQSGVVISTGIEDTSTMDHSDHHDASHNHADMVTSEFDFIYLMIPHHQEAVDTAKVLLTQTSNPSLIELGENIITSQTTEIQTMNSWLTGRYSGEVYTGMGYMPMMRGANNLSGESYAMQWTEDMIKHHQGAIDMAVKVLSFSNTRSETKDLANQIILDQTKEINLMKSIFTGTTTP